MEKNTDYYEHFFFSCLEKKKFSPSSRSYNFIKMIIKHFHSNLFKIAHNSKETIANFNQSTFAVYSEL